MSGKWGTLLLALALCTGFARTAESPIEQAHPTIAGVRTIRLASDGTDVTSGVGVFGMKWNLGSTWLLNASVAVPLTDNGLKSRPVPSVSLDYAFGR